MIKTNARLGTAMTFYSAGADAQTRLLVSP